METKSWWVRLRATLSMELQPPAAPDPVSPVIVPLIQGKVRPLALRDLARTHTQPAGSRGPSPTPPPLGWAVPAPQLTM